MQILLSLSKHCKSSLETFADVNADSLRQILGVCYQVLGEISPIRPKIKPFIAEYTDAGPGVGVSNLQVCFRFAELCILQCSQSRIRLHRAPGDSGQNEVERTHAYVGDSLVDGAALNWQHYDVFDGLSEENVTEMSYDEFEKHLVGVTEKNAWATAQEIAMRIDDEPGPSGGYHMLLRSKVKNFFITPQS